MTTEESILFERLSADNKQLFLLVLDLEYRLLLQELNNGSNGLLQDRALEIMRDKYPQSNIRLNTKPIDMDDAARNDIDTNTEW